MHATELAAANTAKEAAVKEVAVLEDRLLKLEAEYAEAQKSAASEGSSIQKQLHAAQSECANLQDRLERVQKVRFSLSQFLLAGLLIKICIPFAAA
jgi:predicted  nucleic acid-binding Zn-ribbon protein